MSLSGELIIMEIKGEGIEEWEMADYRNRMLEESMDSAGEEGEEEMDIRGKRHLGWWRMRGARKDERQTRIREEQRRWRTGLSSRGPKKRRNGRKYGASSLRRGSIFEQLHKIMPHKTNNIIFLTNK